MEFLKRGMDMDNFIDDIGTCTIERYDKKIIDVIVPLGNLKGFVRGNEGMKACYTFIDNKLDHMSIII